MPFDPTALLGPLAGWLSRRRGTCDAHGCTKEVLGPGWTEKANGFTFGCCSRKTCFACYCAFLQAKVCPVCRSASVPWAVGWNGAILHSYPHAATRYGPDVNQVDS